MRISAISPFALAACALFGGAVAHAQTLQQSLAVTWRESPALNAQRAALLETRESYDQAAAGWKPFVTLSGQYGAYDSSIETGPNGDLAVAALSVRGNLYAGGETQAGINLARENIAIAETRLLSAEQSVLLQAVGAHLNVLSETKVFGLNLRNEARLGRHLEAIQQRFELGDVTLTDVSRAEASLAQARAARLASQSAVETARAVYLQVTGLQPGGLEEPEEGSVAVPASRDEAIMLARQQHPDVLAAQRAVEAARYAIDIRAAALRPDLDWEASAGRYRDRRYMLESRHNDMSAQATLSIPLYQAGLPRSQIRAARQALTGAERGLDGAYRDAAQGAASSWDDMESSRAQLTAIDKEIAAYRKTLEGVELEVEVGSRPFLDILDAEQDLLDAETRFVRAQYQAVLARYSLAAAVGRLNPVALGLAVAQK